MSKKRKKIDNSSGAIPEKEPVPFANLRRLLEHSLAQLDEPLGVRLSQFSDVVFGRLPFTLPDGATVNPPDPPLFTMDIARDVPRDDQDLLLMLYPRNQSAFTLAEFLDPDAAGALIVAVFYPDMGN